MKVVFLVTGSGQRLQGVLDAWCFGKLHNCEPVVIATEPTAYALRRAAAAGVKNFVVERSLYNSDAAFTAALTAGLLEIGAELVVLADYDCPLDAAFLHTFANRVIAVWPSLLPAYPPMETEDEQSLYQAMLDRGVRVTGATVFLVTERPGEGPILLQRPVGVLSGDDVKSLAQRVLTEGEQPLLTQAVALACAGRFALRGNRVEILEPRN